MEHSHLWKGKLKLLFTSFSCVPFALKIFAEAEIPRSFCRICHHHTDNYNTSNYPQVQNQKSMQACLNRFIIIRESQK